MLIVLRRGTGGLQSTFAVIGADGTLKGIGQGNNALANAVNIGGRSAALAGTAGIEITFRIRQASFSRNQVQMDADRSAVLTTTPANP